MSVYAYAGLSLFIIRRAKVYLVVCVLMRITLHESQNHRLSSSVCPQLMIYFFDHQHYQFWILDSDCHVYHLECFEFDNVSI